MLYKHHNNIFEFLESFDPDQEAYYRVNAAYNQLNNYYCGDVPVRIQESFMRDHHRDYILENLQTHDWKLLYKSIKNRYPNASLYSNPPDGESPESYFKVKFDFPDCLDERCFDFCQKKAKFFGYFASEHPFLDRVINFEPIYTKEVKDELLKSDFVYHIMPYKDHDDVVAVESVEKNGLRARNGRLRPYKDPVTGKRKVERYRNFDPRVYVYRLDGKLAKTDADRERQFWSLLRMKDLDWNECAIFAIDIHHFFGNFYRDSVADDDHSAFTYQNIPPDRITRIH